MPDQPLRTLERLDHDLDELAGQAEGQQLLLDFLIETLAMNLAEGNRLVLRQELQKMADHFGNQSEGLAFHRAIRALAQPPRLRLVPKPRDR